MKNATWYSIVALCLVPLGAAFADETKPPADFPDSPPQAEPLKPSDLPPAFSEKLDNGMEVLVISNDEIPWVTATWYAPVGAKYDPPGKEGLASTTGSLLRQGTAKHSADELAEVLDFNAINLGGGASYETTTASCGALAKDVELAVELLAEVIRTPTFPAKEFRRHMSQAISGMAVQEQSGDYWAEREIKQRIYGKHYLARQSEGTSETLPQIKPEDLVEFHKKHYVPNGTMLIFSGAIESDKAVSLAKKFFGDWASGQLPELVVEKIPEPSETHIYLVDRPAATQSKIRVGQIGFRRNDPQYIPSQVFNQVFGGSFNSRLNSKVRVEEGLTYGARGGFTAGKEPGHMIASTFTKNESTGETVKAVLSVIQGMQTDPPTTEELADAKSYIIGQFGLSMETPQAVAGKVFDLKFFGLPQDYYKAYLAKVQSLSATDITDFAGQTIDPSKLAIVVVGNAKEVEEQLSDVAPVTVIQLDQPPRVD